MQFVTKKRCKFIHFDAKPSKIHQTIKTLKVPIMLQLDAIGCKKMPFVTKKMQISSIQLDAIGCKLSSSKLYKGGVISKVKVKSRHRLKM